MDSFDKEEVIKSLEKRLNDGLQKKHYSVFIPQNTNASPLRGRFPCDIIVMDNNKPIALFSIKPTPTDWVYLYTRTQSFVRNLESEGINYYIITDGKQFWERSSRDIEFNQNSLEVIIHAILNNMPVLGPRPSQEEIKEYFLHAGIKAGLKQRASINRFIERKREKPLFAFDEKSGSIMFSAVKTEDSFFSFLLNGRIPSNLCRFTTRHNLFLLLKDKKQNMCSIVCMNDKSEENYADDAVGRKDIKRRIINENNNCFIISLLPEEKSDDLTMWRLYGDDAKGVCLNYKIENRQRGRRLRGGFYISSINYGIGENKHLELEYLNSIINLEINHWHFNFNRWFIWKHFFKSFRFKDEKEVRLLYLSDGKEEKENIRWIENENSGIVSKMLLFSLNDTSTFPLCLSGALIGPKSPEPTKIAEQFKYLVSEEWGKDSSIIIRESKISEYR